MSGEWVSFYDTSNFVGLASEDTSSNQAHILLGSIGNASSVEVNLINLNDAPVVNGDTVHVSVQEIPNTNSSALLSLGAAEIDGDYQI